MHTYMYKCKCYPFGTTSSALKRHFRLRSELLRSHHIREAHPNSILCDECPCISNLNYNLFHETHREIVHCFTSSASAHIVFCSKRVHSRDPQSTSLPVKFAFPSSQIRPNLPVLSWTWDLGKTMGCRRRLIAL